MADFTSNGSVLDKKSEKDMHSDASFILCFIEKEEKVSISSNKKDQRKESEVFVLFSVWAFLS